MTDRIALPTSLKRTVLSQALCAARDLPLVGVAGVAAVLSASIAASIPTDVALAPDAEKVLLAETLSTVIAVYAAVMAAIYGSFRYTIDRRVGVVAQRATVQPRGWALVGRIPFTALGGAAVGMAALLGARLALVPAFALLGLHARDVAATIVVAAAASLWGLGVGLLVQAHLPALFVAPISLSLAVMLAPVWPTFCEWLPLPTFLRAGGLDLSVLGLADGGVDQSLAVLIASVWLVGVVVVGAGSFLRRDLR
ncbi:hypothetical protein MHY30_02505 [Microbacterium sp. ACRRU]|uniref:hypothetical protein n=1 Tax=Microbacterium sp. ACRRU TaxID=2918204 RepID=UPI001EF65F1A|nr:hypothetical protein [Microbacterium sp. ACRRU]MCG7416382.1 hypothetical protein [Microbacterium sp. ACRRU]